MRGKMRTFFLALFLCMMQVVPVSAEAQYPRLVDGADLLISQEESEVLSRLNSISEKQQLDVVIVTTDSLDGKTPTEYADDFYDYNGYGFGDECDGILFLVSMEDRDWAISTTGYGITAFTEDGQEYIMDGVVPRLSDGDYGEAFLTFAGYCDQFVSQARAGEPYDEGNLPREPMSPVWIPASLVIGALIAFLILSVMTSKLKTVRYQSAASNYTRDGSMNISKSRDFYLYRHVSRTPKPKDDNKQGGGIHMGSSGSSHGGSSGKF